MNSTNRKPPGVRGLPQAFRQGTGPAHRFRPLAAQSKNVVSVQSVNRPVAATVYRPQSKPLVAQAKMAGPSQLKTQPVAPPAYRPQSKSVVAQAKMAVAPIKSGVSAQSVRRPIAPPVYRPQQIPKVLQKKSATAQSSRSAPAPRRPVALPRNHSEQNRIAQLKTVATARARTPPARSLSASVIQRAEIEMLPIMARTATCRTIGVQHENGKSFASVHSIATHLQETDRAIYEIAWDAAVAPVGHDGMAAAANVASDFVVDKSQSGEAIGDSRTHYRRDGVNGWVFEFRDGIEWPEDLNGGRWRFRLRVVNGAGTEKARSAEAIVDWNH